MGHHQMRGGVASVAERRNLGLERRRSAQRARDGHGAPANHLRLMTDSRPSRLDHRGSTIERRNGEAVVASAEAFLEPTQDAPKSVPSGDTVLYRHKGRRQPEFPGQGALSARKLTAVRQDVDCLRHATRAGEGHGPERMSSARHHASPDTRQRSIASSTTSRARLIWPQASSPSARTPSIAAS